MTALLVALLVAVVSGSLMVAFVLGKMLFHLRELHNIVKAGLQGLAELTVLVSRIEGTLRRRP